jgi:hypothetical protein
MYYYVTFIEIVCYNPCVFLLAYFKKSRFTKSPVCLSACVSPTNSFKPLGRIS